MEANLIVILISLTLFLAYISGILYTITRVPDNIWLIGFGVLLGPILGFYDPGTMVSIIPFIVLMVLNLLMFEAGLNVDLKTFRKSMEKSGYLGLITFTITMFVVGYWLHFLAPSLFTLTEGLLLGAMIGGTSTETVLSLLGCIGLTSVEVKECNHFLVLESIVTDSLSIVTSMTLIRIIQTQGIPLSEGFWDIMFVFIVALVVGFGVGVTWVQLLDLARNGPFNYMMTLAVLFSSYLLGEQIGGPGAGALTGLIFGVTMTNYHLLANRFNLRAKVRVERRRLRAFHREITFLLKSFMFFFIGLQLNLSVKMFTLGLATALLMGVIRYISVYGTNYFKTLSTVEMNVATIDFSNGLTALVLAQLPALVNITDRFTNPSIYIDLVAPVVIFTALFGSLFGPILIQKRLRDNP